MSRKRSAKPSEQRVEEMWKCAYLRFVSEPRLMTKEIAKRLTIDRSTVSRRLSRAVREGIIRFVVEPPPHLVLEEALKDRFDLTGVRVIRTLDQAGEEIPESALSRLLGASAASYIEPLIEDKMSIGLAGGVTINETIRALRPARRMDIDVYALVGPTTFDTATSAAGHVRAMCDKYWAGRVRGHELLPFAPRSGSDKDRLLRMPRYKEAYQAAFNVSLALVGIGSFAEGSTLWQTLHNLQGIDWVMDQEAVGDIGYQLYNSKGEHVPSPLDDLTVAVTADRLRQLHQDEGKQVVAIAGGASKTDAIRGALRGRFFNILVTDEATAHKLLEM